jgi:hypothetical protein
MVKGKGNIIQAWRGPEGSRILMLPEFLENRHMKFVSWLSALRADRLYTPGNIPGTHFYSDRTMTLGSTQPLVKMSTRNIPGGKDGRCVRLTTSPSCAQRHEIWEPKPPGTLWTTPGLLQDCCTVYSFLSEAESTPVPWCG